MFNFSKSPKKLYELKKKLEDLKSIEDPAEFVAEYICTRIRDNFYEDSDKGPSRIAEDQMIKLRSNIIEFVNKSFDLGLDIIKIDYNGFYSSIPEWAEDVEGFLVFVFVPIKMEICKDVVFDTVSGNFYNKHIIWERKINPSDIRKDYSKFTTVQMAYITSRALAYKEMGIDLFKTTHENDGVRYNSVRELLSIDRVYDLYSKLDKLKEYNEKQYVEEVSNSYHTLLYYLELNCKN